MTGAVVFDLDGTLLDTPRAIVATFAATFVRLGVAGHATEEVRATIGRPLEDAFAALLGERDRALVAAAIQEYQRLYRERIIPAATELLFPGVTQGLAALAAGGLRLAVATNKHRASADALLIAAGLRHHFELVVGADSVRCPKPDAEAALLVSQVLAVEPAHAIVVGDTTTDLRMAKNAGMRSVGVTYGIHDASQLATADPTWLADSFDAAVKLILGAG